jgi:uncharacterized damage-inducible protein DinB
VTVADVFVDAFGRIREEVHEAVEGLTPERLAVRLDPGANSIAWLVWHLTRVQDDHMADVADRPQVWTSDGWAQRFALPLDAADTGFGHSSDEVAVVRASADLLAGYYDAVHAQSLAYLRGVTDADLSRVVDDAWDPPTTLGVRLVSVADDGMQHAGQALFVRGILERGGGPA